MKNGRAIGYRVYPSIVAPVLLGIAFTAFGIIENHWLFLAIPFAVLGSLCAAPNLNLADGFLVLVSTLIGLALVTWVSKPVGGAIIAGSLSGWFIGSIEKRIRMKPVDTYGGSGQTH